MLILVPLDLGSMVQVSGGGNFSRTGKAFIGRRVTEALWTASVPCGEEGEGVTSPLLRTSGLGLGVGSKGNSFRGSPRSCCDIIRNRAYPVPLKLLSVDQVMGHFPCGTALLSIFPDSQRSLPKEHLRAAILCLGWQVHSSSLPSSFLPSFFLLRFLFAPLWVSLLFFTPSMCLFLYLF